MAFAAHGSEETERGASPASDPPKGLNPVGAQVYRR
jgi:hypothetical protein